VTIAPRTAARRHPHARHLDVAVAVEIDDRISARSCPPPRASPSQGRAGSSSRRGLASRRASRRPAHLRSGSADPSPPRRHPPPRRRASASHRCSGAWARLSGLRPRGGSRGRGCMAWARAPSP
jgi:hypothetical protein